MICRKVAWIVDFEHSRSQLEPRMSRTDTCSSSRYLLLYLISDQVNVEISKQWTGGEAAALDDDNNQLLLPVQRNR
jgi:hypothetical protein